MATWTNMTPVSDGQVLSASFLNSLSENIRYLWERAQQVNVPRETETISSVDGSEPSESYAMVHKFGTFEWHMSVSAGDVDDISVGIYDNDVLVGNMMSESLNSFSAGHVFSGTFAYPGGWGLVIGNVYKVKVKAASIDPGNCTVSINILQEIP